MRIYFYFLSFIFYPLILQAQTTTIEGIVKDVDDLPLPGVNVTVKETAKGIITNVEGAYSIVANKGEILVFSFIGMQAEEFVVGDDTKINVTLFQDNVMLGEVVAVGYGSAQVKDLTAPIATVELDEIENFAVSNAAQALQGRVAGVTVTQSGDPGSSPTIRMRGQGSIEGSADPLYVVDGVLMSDISFLGANDIESISILKDASSASIYGVRAANGVIIVTTKKGKAGENNLQYSGYFGVRQVSNLLPMTGGREYIELLNEKFVISGNNTTLNPDDYPNPVNWFDEIFRTAKMQSHTLSLTGGTEKSTYSFGLGYLEEEGILDKSDYERVNIRASAEYKVGGNIKMGYSVNISPWKKNNAPNSAIKQAFIIPSVIPPRDDDGNFIDPSVYGLGRFANPALTIENQNNSSDGLRIVGNGFAELSFLEDKSLKFRTSLGVEYGNTNDFRYNPYYYISANLNDTIPTLYKAKSNSRNYFWDNTLTYEKTFNSIHKVKVMAGMTAQENKGNFISAERQYVYDYGEGSLYLKFGDIDGQTNNDGGHKIRGQAYFGRLFYSFSDKYLLTTTLRADGSSTFSKDYRWGTFPSVGLGWVATKEDFLQSISFLNYLKLRGNWGILGNNNIPQNEYTLTTSTSGRYSVVYGPYGSSSVSRGENITTLIPPELKWEKIQEFDLGLDAYVLNSRLNIQFDYYHRTTKDALFRVASSGAAGASADYLDNNADILNRGIELTLGWSDKINKDFSYSITGNMTTIHNEVKKLKTGTTGVWSGGVFNGNLATYTREGHPIGEFYVLEVVGIFQTQEEIDNYVKDGNKIMPDARPGDFIYKDQNGDGVIDDNDRISAGSYIPKVTFGLNISLNYKNLDFSMDVNGVAGNKIYNAQLKDRYGNENYYQDFYDNRWHGEGTSNSYPSADLNGGRNMEPNTFFVEDGSYLNINSIQLGYLLPQSIIDRIRIRKCRIYFNVQNPFTFFKYNGFTPQIAGGRALERGIDRTNVYPLNTTYNIGANINF